MLIEIHRLLTAYLLLPALLVLGIYLTAKLRFLQIAKLKMGFRYLFRSEEGAEGNITRYQAVSSILAGNFGTGNISGMAVALSMGGSGALVWMWIMAFFGSIIQYASCLLAIKYRERDAQGEYIGGPMVYLARGLGFEKLGALFALLVMVGAIGVGIFCQINSVSLSLEKVGVTPWITGVLIAAAVALVLVGGVQRIAKVAAAVIPFIALLYLGSSLFILGGAWEKVLPAFLQMLRNAFDFRSVAAGAAGFGMMHVISTGVGRALFATDVGTGYVPILQAGAKSRHCVIDGAVALVAPLMVMVVCTITSLVLIVTGADQIVGLQSTAAVVYAFQLGIGEWTGSVVVNTALLLFGYTTILAWACCFDRAVVFLFGRRWISLFRAFFIALIPLSAFFSLGFVWAFADCALALMTVVNLVGIFGLTREVVAESRTYFLESRPEIV